MIKKLRSLSPATLRFAMLMVILTGSPAFAQVAVDIGTAGTGPLAGLATFFQEIVDFMAGPWAIFVLAGGLILAIGLWVFQPKESGAMQWLFRALFGGVMLMNIGGFIAWIQGMAT